MSDSNNKVVITDGVKGAAWIMYEMVVEKLVNEGIIDEPVVLREDQDGLFLGRFNKRLYLTYDSDPALSCVYQSVKLWMPEVSQRINGKLLLLNLILIRIWQKTLAAV